MQGAALVAVRYISNIPMFADGHKGRTLHSSDNIPMFADGP